MKRYITTAIPYANGEPHLGHAMDYLLADVAARYFRSLGDEVRFQAGTDEHGNKNFQKATNLGLAVEDFVAQNSAKFQDFIASLSVTPTDFIRTTDPAHEQRVQQIWQKLQPHIYSADYEGWYCEGCESFVTEKEYEENHGSCPDHQKPYIRLSESNYYFRISDFKDDIKRAIESDEMLILPASRKHQVLNLLKDSPDISISRPRKNLSWGIPVPGDDSQVMYVWLDALSNYITVLGYPDTDISDFWPATAQFVGKDILRFHAIIWPAMLLGLGLPLPQTIVSHGFIEVNGEKMSKSVGNVVSPNEVLSRYGLPAFRYYFLRHVDTFADSDFNWDTYANAYNKELANDLGNLVQRLATLCQKNNFSYPIHTPLSPDNLPKEYHTLMRSFRFKAAFDLTWDFIQSINKKIDETKPWALAKAGDTAKLSAVLESLVSDLLTAATMLAPFLPGTAETITNIFTTETITPPSAPLFPRF